MGYVVEGQDGQKIYLIDTPGFDDTHTDDAKVFREIASILCTICDIQPLSICGIIYVQRITDMRMAGTALKSVRLFEKLCGEDCFGDVTIVTTMWSMLRNQEAREAAYIREEMLRKRLEFFGGLVNSGARLVRYGESRDSALNIVQGLVLRKRKILLKLQKEMMTSERITLAQTTAGRYLEGELANTRERYEREKKELEEYETEMKGDVEMAESIVEQKKEHASRIEKNKMDQGSLAVTRNILRNERREWIRKVHTEDSVYNENEKPVHVQHVEEELQRLRRGIQDQHRENKEQNLRVEALEKALDEQLRREKAKKERIQRLTQLPFVQFLRNAFTTPQQPRRTDSLPHDTKVPKRQTQKSNKKKNKRSKSRQNGKSGNKTSSSSNKHHETSTGETQGVQEPESSDSDEESEDGYASRSQSPVFYHPANMPVQPKNVVYSEVAHRVPTPPPYPPYQIAYVTPNHTDTHTHYGAQPQAYYYNNYDEG